MLWSITSIGKFWRKNWAQNKQLWWWLLSLGTQAVVLLFYRYPGLISWLIDIAGCSSDNLLFAQTRKFFPNWKFVQVPRICSMLSFYSADMSYIFYQFSRNFKMSFSTLLTFMSLTCLFNWNRANYYWNFLRNIFHAIFLFITLPYLLTIFIRIVSLSAETCKNLFKNYSIVM